MSFNLIDYLPVLLMFIVAAGFAITFIGLSQLLGQRKRTRTKLMPYECGKDPVGSARERFSVKFYLIAMLFILFDIEVIFLVPWAVVFKTLADPYVGKVFREGLTAIRDEVLARDSGALPGATSNHCTFCWYVLTKGVFDATRAYREENKM